MKLGTELDEQMRPDLGSGLNEKGESPPRAARLKIALLTGGIDKPYVLGLADALTADAIMLEIIGSDELNVPELRGNPRVRFLNLRGDQNPVASLGSKALRVSRYYLRLIRYAATIRVQRQQQNSKKSNRQCLPAFEHLAAGSLPNETGH